MDSPLIDIYLPTYKPNEAYLTAAIDSVVAQTEERWNLWIVDQVTELVDTQTMVWQYFENTKITYKPNQDNPGIGANWNECLQYGSAPYVQYLFQDDVWNSEYLATALRIMESYPDVGIVSMGHTYLYEGNVQTDSYDELQNFKSFHLSEGRRNGQEFLFWWADHGWHPNVVGEPVFVMLRREVMEQVGFFRQDMHQGLDSEYWARTLTKTNWFYQPGEFGQFRVHEAAASAQNAQAGRGLLDRARIFQAVVPLLEGNEKKRMQKIRRQQIGKMLEKFIERYAKKRVPFTSRDTPETYAMKHWWLMLKAMWAYGQKHSSAWKVETK